MFLYFTLYLKYLLQHSVAINNFNAAAALIGGLSHSSVSRLRPTWEVNLLLLLCYHYHYHYQFIVYGILIL